MVKVLSRDAVQRMTGRRSSSAVNIGGGSGDASGVSRAWVDENYVSKNFFNQLFTIHGTRTYIDEETEQEVTEEVTITPNAIVDGEEYKLSNVEVSVGLWTKQFLSALGLNPGGGGGGGIDMTTVWSALAGNTTEQINKSHLTTALDGYALKTDIPNIATLSWSGYSSGSYNGSTAASISIPTDTSQLTNGAGYVTASIVNDYAKISLVDGRLSMNIDTNGDNVDFNEITYNTSAGIVIQPVHIPNYSGCSNYPFYEYGTLVTFSGSTFFPFQLASYQGGALYYRADNFQQYSQFNFNDSTGWVRLIDSSNIGSQSVSYATSAGSATKLSTAITIWGQSFDGTGNVSGDITDAGNIFAKGDYLLLSSGKSKYGLMVESTSWGDNRDCAFGFHAATSGHDIAWSTRSGQNDICLDLVIDPTNTVAKRYTRVYDALRIGDGMIVWDSANNALKVIKINGDAANFYATGGVSALGIPAGTSVSDLTLATATITDRLRIQKNGFTHNIYGNSNGTLIIEGSEYIALNNDVLTNGYSISTEGGNINLKGGTLHFNSTHYLRVSGNTLQYYNGSTFVDLT